MHHGRPLVIADLHAGDEKFSSPAKLKLENIWWRNVVSIAT
jgi:hypothetical protein